MSALNVRRRARARHLRVDAVLVVQVDDIDAERV